MVVKRGRGRLFGRRRKTVRFLLQKQLIENRNSGLLSNSAYLHLAKDAKEPFFAGACSLTRECRLFFCVRFLSLPWGGLMHAPVLCAGAGSGGAYARHAAPAAASRSSWAAFPLFRPSPCPGHVFLSFLLRNIFRGPNLCRFSGGLPTCFFM